MPNTSKDFEELFASFARLDVKFLIVGAYAVAFFAKPRYTKDIDVFVEASVENGLRIVAALDEFGFGSVGLTAADFAHAGQIIQLGVPPTRIDLLTSIDGIGFEAAWSSRVAARYGSADVFYIGREALLTNKKASGRPQDLLDVQTLSGE